MGARTFETAIDRWAGVGPYYAMFPVRFADRVVKRYTKPGDTVLDPFAGRGTAVFSAAANDRCAVGIELNPVGWLYSRTKLAPADKDDVADRLKEIGGTAARYRVQADALPPFFRVCFSRQTREFLIAAREQLNWKQSRVDRTTMALLLVHLHGKRTDSLSNQMRQTKSMSPDYAIRWWRERRMLPPRLDPVEFLTQKLAWRYAKGVPELKRNSKVYLANSVEFLPSLQLRVAKGELARASLLFTSPPYFGLTNYHYDQWLRLWVLGGAPNALRQGGKHRGKFEHPIEYRALLSQVFTSAANVLKRDAVVYVRTDCREVTCQITVDTLKSAFPKHRLTKHRRPFEGPTQTRLFGDHEPKVGEVDLILTP